MPLHREPSGGAPLLDAVLYGDIWVLPARESLDRAHVCPSDLSRTTGDDHPGPANR